MAADRKPTDEGSQRPPTSTPNPANVEKRGGIPWPITPRKDSK